MAEWRSIEMFVDEDPAQRDDQREDDEQVAGEGRRLVRGVRGSVASAERDECGADGRDDEGEPAGRVHALVGEEVAADGEQDRHGADHQRGMRDGGAIKAGELDEELEGDSEEGAEEQGSPLAAVEAGPVGEEQREQHQCGEEEAVEHHGADAHLGQRDLAEEEAAAPERACERAGGEAEGAVLGGHGS